MKLYVVTSDLSSAYVYVANTQEATEIIKKLMYDKEVDVQYIIFKDKNRFKGYNKKAFIERYMRG